jgi:uncharacterized protein
MPFERLATAPRRIAVIGAGISGMGAAHALADSDSVVLFEAAGRLGGHARTLIAGKRGDQPVDTGFIVFNYANYPNMARLFADLDVPVVKSDMSFGASIDGGRIEYALTSLDAIFAQRRNLLRPAFLGMLRDVLRFNAQADATTRDPAETVGAMIGRLRLGAAFRDHYLLPLSGAIWSTPVEKILDFPAEAMIRFFRNHALMQATGQHQWYTVQGGSVEYVRRLGASMAAKGVDLRLSCPIEAVRRIPGGVEIRARGAEWEVFDAVVFATHPDDSLRMLADPSPEERAALGAVTYQPNEVVLHADTSIMPRSRKVWSSWNYTEEAGKPTGRIDLTYWMNRLQPIPQDDPLFVTLNATRRIDPRLIHDIETFRHPVYDLAALAAQEAVRGFNGARATWFCGAWMKNGFHEDGLSSGLDVVAGLRAEGECQVAAA